MLKPLFEQLVPTAETFIVKQVSEKAVKARMPGEVVKDFEKLASWNPMAKKALELSGAQLAAKYMNKAGVSAEYQPEVTFGTALCSIVAGHVLMMRKMDELIAKTNPPAAQPAVKPAEEKKP